MSYKKFLIIVYIGAVIVAISDWGSPASFWTLVIVGITAVLIPSIKFGFRKYRKDHPFRLRYMCGDYVSSYSDVDIDTQRRLPPKQDWLKSKTKLSLKPKSKYGIHLQAAPLLGEDITRAEIRFNPEVEGQPYPKIFQDITPPAKLYGKPANKLRMERAMAISYMPEMPIIIKGEPLYYLVDLETDTEWQGKIEIEFSLKGIGKRLVGIDSIVT